MARGVRASLCSYKKITIAVCLFNLVIALLILRSLYSAQVNRNSFSERRKYTEEQIERLKETIRIRDEAQPIELLKAVKRLKKERILQLKKKVNLSPALKQKLADEILERLSSLKDGSNATDEIEAVQLWRSEKLNDFKTKSKGKNSTKEAKILKQAIESKSNWLNLMEEIGLWFPPNITNPEHDDKPPNEPEEEEIIPGPPLDPLCNPELHTDYGGAAVRWGLTHHKESAAECCKACIDQSNKAKPGEMRCNVWVYCPSEFGCWSPDIYQHKHQECWLKMAERPQVNFKDKYSEAYRDSHPTAPVVVPWMSGVINRASS